MTKQDLENALKFDSEGSPTGVELEWIKANDLGFSRVLKVITPCGLDFEIKWYVNLLTVTFSNGVELLADNLLIRSTYPNRAYKSYIHFFNKGKDMSIYVPFEK